MDLTNEHHYLALVSPNINNIWATYFKEISSQNNRENTNETYNLSLKMGLLQLGLTWSMYENESLKNDTPIIRL